MGFRSRSDEGTTRRSLVDLAYCGTVADKCCGVFLPLPGEYSLPNLATAYGRHEMRPVTLVVRSFPDQRIGLSDAKPLANHKVREDHTVATGRRFTL